MNIIQIQERLKGMPKSSIVEYIKNPTGDVPTFLALGELQRRRDVENKYSAMKEPASTVSEQIVEENMPMGIASMAPSTAMNPSRAMRPSTAMNPESGIARGKSQTLTRSAQPSSAMAANSGIGQLPVPNQNFNSGGIVSFAEGDLVEVDDINPYSPFAPNVGEMKPIGVPESYTPDEFLEEKREYAEQFGIDPEFYKKQAEDLKTEREALKKDKSQAANMALIKAGLGIAGGRSQFALENLKEGALPAIEAYGADIKDIKQQDRLLKDSDRKLQQAQQAEARGDMKTAKSLMQQREAVQLKVMELNQGTLQALAKAKGLTSDQFKTANEIMKTKFGDAALKTQFQNDINLYNNAFNQIVDDISKGKLTTGADVIGSKYTNIDGIGGESATPNASTPNVSTVDLPPLTSYFTK